MIAGDARPVPGNFRFALETDYLTASAASDDDPAATESVVQETLRPVLVYSPLEQLNLVLQVPVTRKIWTLTARGARTGSTTPVSGISILARDGSCGNQWT